VSRVSPNVSRPVLFPLSIPEPHKEFAVRRCVIGRRLSNHGLSVFHSSQGTIRFLGQGTVVLKSLSNINVWSMVMGSMKKIMSVPKFGMK